MHTQDHMYLLPHCPSMPYCDHIVHISVIYKHLENCVCNIILITSTQAAQDMLNMDNVVSRAQGGHRVHTRTGKPGKPGKMGRFFPVREKSGNFKQTGKVREKSGKITQNTGKLREFEINII